MANMTLAEELPIPRSIFPRKAVRITSSVGDPLPDTLSGLLSGSPFVYTVAVAPTYFSGGPHIGAAAINRNGFAFFAQDTWKISPRLVLDYGLRYELYTPVTERAKQNLGHCFYHHPHRGGATIPDQPTAGLSLQSGWPGTARPAGLAGRRQIHLRAGGAITTIPPNLYQDNFAHRLDSLCHLSPSHLGCSSAHLLRVSDHTERVAAVYTPSGQMIFANGTKAVPGEHRHGSQSLPDRIWLSFRPAT